ncbi:LOW QUALITY PROTEIN: separin [Ornithorhynchus anatinus]|uniref:LOW QUALITY PROTEIN: separin n=1 Tax=Ornithorhynchus anatinus TaxID=9258 RepID=UPI0010A8A5E7|nr:LOW QUALITY PROTEIN: separin [Ornithorhynchus anatinus]
MNGARYVCPPAKTCVLALSGIMKSLKRADFEKRTGSQEEVAALLSDLKELLSIPEGRAPEQRQACDATLRACNHQVASGPGPPAHLAGLLELVELATRGYLDSTPRRPPLYLERILAVLLGNVAARGAPEAALRVAGPLHACLVRAAPEAAAPRDLETVVRNAFCVLWKAAEALGDRRAACAARLRAAAFLALLEDAGVPGRPPPFASPAACQAAAACRLFDPPGGAPTREDARFLGRELAGCLEAAAGRTGAPPSGPRALCLLELTLERCRRLCRAGCFQEAGEAAEEPRARLEGAGLGAGGRLCLLGVELHRDRDRAGETLGRAAAELRGALGTPAPPLWALAASGQFLLSALEGGARRDPGPHAATGLSRFLDQYCLLLRRLRGSVSADSPKQQRALTQMHFHGLQLFTAVIYDLFHGCPAPPGSGEPGARLAARRESDSELAGLEEPCRRAVGWMLEALEGLTGTEEEENLTLAASCTSNLAYGFYSRKLYAQAAAVLEPLCRRLSAVEPGSGPRVAAEKLHRCFRLQVESLRKLDQGGVGAAAAAVTSWLEALRPHDPRHVVEPVGLWARVKVDAGKVGAEELRLRTLRDALPGRSPETLTVLLAEELRAYKGLRADTGRERFNVICDLLELCPEAPAGGRARAVHLLELAQVLCYNDLARQTDCTALDAVREALELLESASAGPADQDRLRDDRAQALLWLHICSLEAKMKKGTERERGARGQPGPDEFEANDLNYEDRVQDDRFLHSGIAFNLLGDAAQSESLDRALALWRSILSEARVPAVRSPKQTAGSLQVLGALYRLAAKPLRALEAYDLLRRLSEALGDPAGVAAAACHGARILLLLECPAYAQRSLEEAESSLKRVDPAADSSLLLAQTCALLRSWLCYATRKVPAGLDLLLGVLRHPALRRPSKPWYLLRAQTLQLLARYLALPPHGLAEELWEELCAQGWHSPETALTDSHKLLRSIVVLLVGSDLFSPGRGAPETPFPDYGDNLWQKWQVLSEVLACSEQLVPLLTRLGSASEAKAFCLEALKLTMKLQTLRWCALFLVLKAELEVTRGDVDLGQADLQQVLFLLESCTEFERAESPSGKGPAIRPQKGQWRTRAPAAPRPPPEEEPFLKGPALELVATVPARLTRGPSASRPAATTAASSSPVLKARPRARPDFLSHPPACGCALCGDPALSVVCLRWAVAAGGAELALGHRAEGEALVRVGLEGCPAAAARLAEALRASAGSPADPPVAPGPLAEVAAGAYALLALEGAGRAPGPELWGLLEAGLDHVEARSPRLAPWRATLLLARALASLSARGCSPARLFAGCWAWCPAAPRPPEARSRLEAPARVPRGRRAAAPPPQGDPPLPEDAEGAGLARPSVACTPRAPGRTGRAGARAPFAVFEESSPPRPEPRLPKAPRPGRRVQSRLKVTFSDDSDLEDLLLRPRPNPRERGAGAGAGAGAAGPQGPAPPLRESGAGRPAGHPRGLPAPPEPARGSGAGSPRGDDAEGPPDLSPETLRASDRDEEIPVGPGSAGGVREVLRRDSGTETAPFPERQSHGEVSELRPIPAPVGLSTLDSVATSLVVAFRCVSRCPPSGLYGHLCRLLALCLGRRDPLATAFLVAESVSVTPRHQLPGHLHRQLRGKTRKQRAAEGTDVAEQLKDLSLHEEAGAPRPLTRLQRLFAFGPAGPSPFPRPEAEAFRRRLGQMPAGVTVCVLVACGLRPGGPGDSLLLTRLERDRDPITVHIPTELGQLSLSAALAEFEAIQKEQKENSTCTDKCQWWTGRLELNRRMEVLIGSLEKHVLGCWRGLLLPPCEDPGPALEAARLREPLRDCGWTGPDLDLLQVALGGAHALTPLDVRSLARGLCPAQPERAEELLREAVERLRGRTARRTGHLVLVLDKHLQKLPWETTPSLRALPVTRLPSLRFLLSYGLLREARAPSVLERGVDPRSAFYVLNPHDNLAGTEERFRDHFCSEEGWQGVVGQVPSSEQLQAALTEHDLYIYAGHGAGARFLDGQAILRLDCRAAALLFGCSSAALAVRGDLDAAGILLKYLMAGCPLFLGNLWDVTDRDIDRYTEALLQGWLGAGSGAPLLQHVAQARQAPRLKHLIGAAPVVYGLPVRLR